MLSSTLPHLLPHFVVEGSRTSETVVLPRLNLTDLVLLPFYLFVSIFVSDRILLSPHFKCVPVSSVLDLSFAFRSLNNRPPLMASLAEYQHQLEHFKGKRTNHSLCLHNSNSVKQASGCEQINSTSLIEDILDDAQFTSLDLFHYWWNTSFTHLSGMLKIDHLHDNIGLKQLSFHPRHVNTVEELLQQANIRPGNFSAVHWRAEKEGMDIMECAKAVLNTRRTIERGDGDDSGATSHPYLLITSLNEDSGKTSSFSFIVGNASSHNLCCGVILQI